MSHARGSPEERLAILETRLDDLVETIDSGPRVPWSKSIRGRLHEIENLQAAADNLSAAARELRRANVVVPRGFFRTVAGTVAVMAAIAAIVAVILQYWS
jgi:hypothetical protein